MRTCPVRRAHHREPACFHIFDVARGRENHWGKGRARGARLSWSRFKRPGFHRARFHRARFRWTAGDRLWRKWTYAYDVSSKWDTDGNGDEEREERNKLHGF